VRFHDGAHEEQRLGGGRQNVIKGLWSIHAAKPLVADVDTPVTVHLTEPELLRQLETKERPEAFVRWDLVCLYATSARQDQALVQVRHLVRLAGTSEQKAAYYLALGQLLELRYHFVDAALCYLSAAETNPADPSRLRRFEALLENHPEIRHRIPNLMRQLWKCRMAVERAAPYGGKSRTS
jgi:IS5 family transposase